jgi:EAL domain-containing protein (putative c-di-GMP-specific phosphodiesterase class I)
LADAGLAAARLELEITENALIANIQAASSHLLRLKVAGVSIVMDDFGTGYSSLGYLRAFPFDKVKIDKSFIRDLGEHSQGSAIIGAVSHLCGKLGITATIEGVETHSQLSQLKDEHCAEGQGYVFGRPMPVEQIRAFMREWPQRWQATD